MCGFATGGAGHSIHPGLRGRARVDNDILLEVLHLRSLLIAVVRILADGQKARVELARKW